eukprot:scaffold318_cov396-Prasinococcus_capsulatus_cf.AAC.12
MEVVSARLSCNRECRTCRLQGTSCKRKLDGVAHREAELPALVEDMRKEFVEPFFRDWPPPGSKADKRSLVEEHTHTSCLVCAYSFTLGDVEVPAMVPFWDFLNHRSPEKANVRLFHCEDSNTLQMIATRNIAANEEVFNTYGPLGNSELVLRYGFFEEDNPHDAVTLYHHDLRDALDELIREAVHAEPSGGIASCHVLPHPSTVSRNQPITTWEVCAADPQPSPDILKAIRELFVGIASRRCLRSSGTRSFEYKDDALQLKKRPRGNQSDRITAKKVLSRVCEQRLEKCSSTIEVTSPSGHGEDDTSLHRRLLADHVVGAERKALSALLAWCRCEPGHT